MYNYTRNASRCLEILSINTSSSNEKKLTCDGCQSIARYSLMFAEHSVTIADCSLRWSVIYPRYFCDALVNISEALAMHPRGIPPLLPSPPPRGGGGGEEEGGGGGVDLYKFLSWFMSVIFLYYFTCMFLSRVYVHFYCLLLFVQCTELMGYYTINSFYYYHYHYYY